MLRVEENGLAFKIFFETPFLRAAFFVTVVRRVKWIWLEVKWVWQSDELGIDFL